MKVPKVFFALQISMAIMVGSIGVSEAGGEGEKVFQSKKCGDCHAISGPNKIASIADWSNRKGPDLWFAGSKFKKEWLENWLKSPEPIRGVKWNSLDAADLNKHPGLSKQEADEVAGYLMDLKDNDVKANTASKKVKKVKSKKLFEKKQACYTCHKVKVKSRTLGGVSGPTFVGVKNRLNPDWIVAFLKNPERYEPKGRMPNFSYLADEDIATLAGYISKYLK